LQLREIEFSSPFPLVYPPARDPSRSCDPPNRICNTFSQRIQWRLANSSRSNSPMLRLLEQHRRSDGTLSRREWLRLGGLAGIGYRLGLSGATAADSNRSR